MKKILSAFIVCLLTVVSLHAEDVLDGTGIIKGKITTADGQLAEDVTISVRGTGKGAITNAEGNFVIKNLPAAAYELEISLLGYQTIYEKVNLANNETRIISIQLQLTQLQLKEVVVLSRKQYFKTSSDFVAKMPLKNLENAQVYNVVSKELLKEQMIFSVDDATKNAPGLQKMWDATARSGDGGAYYNSRGFIMQSQFRNGVAGNISSRIDAVNLENLEIIKGPSATLFGSTMSSYGGLINRVTKKPYAKFGGEIAYSTGSYGFNRISADVNAPLNEAKDLLFRLNTAYTSENSFQDNGWEKGYAVAPSLTYHLNNKLSFQFDAEFYSGANTSKQMIFFYFPADQLNAHNPRELGIDYKRAYSSNDIFQTYNN
jgi:iron complex outermembrane receptor protein